MTVYFCFNENEPTEGMFIDFHNLQSFVNDIQDQFGVTVFSSTEFHNFGNEAPGFKLYCADNAFLELVEFDIYCIPKVENITYFG